MCMCISASALIGCGSMPDEEPKSVLGPSSEEALNELKAMLLHLEEKKQPMPRGQQDLAAVGPFFPSAEVFLSNGSVVYAWGSKISSDASNADKVIAYESKAAKEGGLVMMQDGTIKTMTAEEFKAANVIGQKK